MQRYYALQRLHHAVYQESSEVFHKYRSKQESLGAERESAIAWFNSPTHSYYQPAVAVDMLLDMLDIDWRVKVLRQAVLLVLMEHFVPAVQSWLGSMDDKEFESLQAVLKIEPDEKVSRTEILSNLLMQSKPPATTSNISRDFMMSGFGISLGPLSGKSQHAGIPCWSETSSIQPLLSHREQVPGGVFLPPLGELSPPHIRLC